MNNNVIEIDLSHLVPPFEEEFVANEFETDNIQTIAYNLRSGLLSVFIFECLDDKVLQHVDRLATSYLEGINVHATNVIATKEEFLKWKLENVRTGDVRFLTIEPDYTKIDILVRITYALSLEERYGLK